MEINTWVNNIHTYAKEAGWWESPRTPLEIHMLCVTELAEGSEEVRNGKPDHYYNLRPLSLGEYSPGISEELTPTCIPKPEGEAVELADTVIRIFDYFGYKGWDLEAIMEEKIAYNKTRGHRHGGKKL